MRQLTIVTAVAAVASCLVAGSVIAANCYIVLDRNENVIYRDPFPPVDMSERGAQARSALEQRGEHLMLVDTDRCPQIAYVFNGGSSEVTFDKTVSGLSPGASSQGAGAKGERPRRSSRGGARG